MKPAITLLLLCAASPLCASHISQLTSLSIPMTTIQQMDKINLSPVAISRIIKTGIKLESRVKSRFIFVCNETNIGVVIDDITQQVISILPKICVYDFHKRQDADDKRKQRRSKSLPF